MKVAPGTKLAELYAGQLASTGSAGGGVVLERHRHRFEVNPKYAEPLRAAGLTISGVTPGMEGRGEGLVEAVELSEHPFFVGLQSHPEFGSRLMRASPPFKGFIAAAVRYQQERARQGAAAEV
jgi:CTP synthase